LPGFGELYREINGALQFFSSLIVCRKVCQIKKERKKVNSEADLGPMVEVILQRYEGHRSKDLMSQIYETGVS